MNPSEFMTLAEQLAVQPGQAELRSAVSRAYYSAFHEARLLLERCGVQLNASAEAHTKVVFCLQNSQSLLVSEAATALGAARKIRNHADYNLHSTLFDPSFTALQLVRYKSASAVFQSSDPLKIGPGVRDYASNVLRLNVTHP